MGMDGILWAVENRRDLDVLTYPVRKRCQVFKNSCRAVVERHADGFDDPLPFVHCHIVHGYEDVTSLAGYRVMVVMSLMGELAAFLLCWLWLKVMLKDAKSRRTQPMASLVSLLTSLY